MQEFETKQLPASLKTSVPGFRRQFSDSARRTRATHPASGEIALIGQTIAIIKAGPIR